MDLNKRLEAAIALGHLQTPILEEVKHVLEHPVAGHVLLIDDARAFTGRRDYPTLDALHQYINLIKPGLAYHVKDDIIRVYREQVTP